MGSLITRQTADGPCCELFNGPFVHVAWYEMYAFLDATQTSHCPYDFEFIRAIPELQVNEFIAHLNDELALNDPVCDTCGGAGCEECDPTFHEFFECDCRDKNCMICNPDEDPDNF